MLNSDKIDLEKLNFLVLDNNVCSLELMFQVLFGFGARNITRCSSTAEAKDIVKDKLIDFIITDDVMADESGYEFLRWLRRDVTAKIRFTPAIIVTGHTRRKHVEQARDCGAHFVISKPLRANILLERIFWVAKDKRMFIDCEVYAGPDRRFNFDCGATIWMRVARQSG